LNDLHRYQNFEKDIYKKALELPKRVRSKVINSGFEGALVFAKEGTSLTFLRLTQEKIEKLSIEEGLKLLKTVKDKKYTKVDSNLDRYLRKIYDNKITTGKNVNLKPRTSEFKLLAMLKFQNLNDEYFKLLTEAVKSRVLPRFYIKQALELIENFENKKQLISKIKKLIPDKYLQVIYDSNNKYIKDAEIIFIEQYS
jgi:hypothetical protein